MAHSVLDLKSVTKEFGFSRLWRRVPLGPECVLLCLGKSKTLLLSNRTWIVNQSNTGYLINFEKHCEHYLGEHAVPDTDPGKCTGTRENCVDANKEEQAHKSSAFLGGFAGRKKRNTFFR